MRTLSSGTPSVPTAPLVRGWIGLAVVLASGACLGDPAGPSGDLVIRRLVDQADTGLVGAPNQRLSQDVAFQVVDGSGMAVPGASIVWTLVSGGGQLDSATKVTGHGGLASAEWVLGTDASIPAELVAHVQTPSHWVDVHFHAHALPAVVDSLRVAADTTTAKLGLPARLQATAVDPYGNHFVPTTLTFVGLDPAVALVDSNGLVHPRQRGFARVVAGAALHTDTAYVHVIQVVDSIATPSDTVSLHALGATTALSTTLIDDQGLPVADSLPSVSIADSGVVAPVTGGLTLRGVTNGVTRVHLAVGTVTRDIVARVQQVSATVSLAGRSFTLSAIPDTLRLVPVVRDSLGSVIMNSPVAYTSGDSAVVTVSAAGLVTARGDGIATVRVGSAGGGIDSATVTVAQAVDTVTLGPDSLTFSALLAGAQVGAVARDRLGTTVAGVAIKYAVTDSAVAAIDSSGVVRAVRNGAATAMATSAGHTATVAIRVAQRPARVLVPSDTIRFTALRDRQLAVGVVVDSLGSRVTGVHQDLSVADSTIATLTDSITVESRANGATNATIVASGLSAHFAVVVQQVPETVVVRSTFGQSIITVPKDSTVPIACAVLDRNGFPAPGTPTVSSRGGAVAGSTCGTVTAQHSAVDTLVVSLGALRSLLPVTLALPMTLGTPGGLPAVLDSLPFGAQPWAPSLRQRADGTLELYIAVYNPTPDSTGFLLDGLRVRRMMVYNYDRG